jgi:hypothetical protein
MSLAGSPAPLLVVRPPGLLHFNEILTTEVDVRQDRHGPTTTYLDLGTTLRAYYFCCYTHDVRREEWSRPDANLRATAASRAGVTRGQYAKAVRLPQGASGIHPAYRRHV